MNYGLCVFKHRLTLLTSELCSNYERYLIIVVSIFVCLAVLLLHRLILLLHILS